MRKHKDKRGFDFTRVNGKGIIADDTFLPFSNDCFDKIIRNHIVEHIADVINQMIKIGWVSGNKAKIQM
jgi:hypothetical protein